MNPFTATPFSDGDKQAPIHTANDERILERSDYVLWSLASPGIVLHEVRHNQYMELDEIGYILWGLLDGARSVDETVGLCLNMTANVGTPSDVLVSQIRNTIEILLAHNFIGARLS